MLSRFGSSPVDDGPARSVIISRSSERRSNKCIYGIATLSLLLASGISADSTLSLENIQAEIDPRVARDDVFRPSSRKYWCEGSEARSTRGERAHDALWTRACAS